MSKLIDINQSRNSPILSLIPGIGFWIRVALFSACWLLLTGWQPSSWGVGAVFILTASSLSFYLTAKQQQAEKWQINPIKIPSFIYYFVVQSLQGGWDIAKLALTPKTKLSPGMINYHTDLETESQIFTLMQVLSLLPGTVSAKQSGCKITIHVINLNSFSRAEIDDCQMRVSELLSSRGRILKDKGDL